MKKTFLVVLLAITVGIFSLSSPLPVMATEIAVVDVQKIMSESGPAKLANAHLKKVQEVLQQGMNDLVAMYKGKENTDEARQAFAQGQNVLNQQLRVEQQAAAVAVETELRNVLATYCKSNPKTAELVVSKQLLLGTGPKCNDITDKVMKLMSKRKPKFPDLPTVTINPPAQPQDSGTPAENAASTPAPIAK